jgi:5-methyltetrahydrofolate--homocysteine methyltransferase
MLIVGERINSSRKRVREAIAARDAEFIQQEARQQDEAGADLIDVNCGTFIGQEAACMEWLVHTVQEATAKPLCLDSPDPETIAAALPLHRNGQPMINSISNEADRITKLAPLVRDSGARVVALCVGKAGTMPQTHVQRIDEASALIEAITGYGVPLGNVYVDPVVCPVANDIRAGLAVMEAIRGLKEKFPGVNTICGLSNVSFGLPLRHLLNQNFLVLCMAAGLDGVILDPLDKRIVSNVLAAEALLGRDEFCMNYVIANRQGRLTV